MTDVLEVLMDAPEDKWCGKYYHAGAYLPIETPLWGIRSSVFDGIVAHIVVPMRSGAPYDGIWRNHYRLLTSEMAKLQMSSLEIESSEDLARRLGTLCQRNHYPTHSLMHIFAWHERKTTGPVTDFAIFQSRRRNGLYEEDGQKHIILDAAPEAVINLGTGTWADIAVEAAARKKTEDKSHNDLIDYSGMRLNRPDGLMARTTLGNIYITHGREVIGVAEGQGAKPCAMKPLLMTAIDEYNHGKSETLRVAYREVEGISDKMLTVASGCFVCDSAVGMVPIMRLGRTFNNELTRQIVSKFRQLF